MVTKAYSYLRFSSCDQSLGDSHRRQQAMAVTYAAEHRLSLDETLTFRDIGVSAFRSRNARSGALRVFLDAVETGLVEVGSVLLVESLDRISRDQILTAQWTFLQIVQSGVDIITLIDGRRYSQRGINDNPLELIISLVAMMRAHEESTTKSRRIKETWVRRRALASVQPMTSQCPGWLQLDKRTKKFKLVPDQAAVIRRIFSDYLAGIGPVGIAKALNAEGCPSLRSWRPARCWRSENIRRLLRSPQVIGTLTPSTVVEDAGERRRVLFEPVREYYPAVVDQGTFLAVQRELEGRRPETPVYNAVIRNIVAGLARCSLCGSLLHAKSGNTRGVSRKYLACEKQGVWGDCRASFLRYEDLATAILSRTDEIREVRSVFLGHTTDDASRTRQFYEAATMGENDPRLELSPFLANAYSSFQRLAKQSPEGAVKVNKALRRCFYAVIVDREADRLLFVWRDGVGGTLQNIWRTPANPNKLVRLQRAKRQVQADTETMHRLYGLLNGKRDARFPLLSFP